MSHGFELADAPRAEAPALPGAMGMLDRALRTVNHVIMLLGGAALVVACLALTHSVVVRYLLRVPTEWQDETAIFLIVGATFLSAASVQARRGHVGIEAVVALLSPRANRVRMIFVDVASFLFCAFFAWKSWTLLDEAWVDGQVTSSTWAPPLWIPYSLMSIGMTLLSLQILLQVAQDLSRQKVRP